MKKRTPYPFGTITGRSSTNAGYTAAGEPNPNAQWFAPKCLQEGAAHSLLEAAGIEKCWNCGEYFNLRYPTIQQYSDYVSMSDILRNE